MTPDSPTAPSIPSTDAGPDPDRAGTDGSVVPVLEVGGTHVTAALVDTARWNVTTEHRLPLDSTADADHILGTFVSACEALPAVPGAHWGVAMPDPFDYEHGIATFRDVGKFDAIYGVNIAALLTTRLPAPPGGLAFLNDADAFVLGEWCHGAAAGFSRCVGITLGTGLGSGWLVDGRITASEPGVPELGRARNLMVHGAGLEETMSRRAIRRAYTAAGGDPSADVREITEQARGGDRTARAALEHAFRGLGTAMGPALRAFRAQVVVIGGSMSASWDLFEPWFRAGLQWPGAPEVRLAGEPEHAALLGAARYGQAARGPVPAT